MFSEKIEVAAMAEPENHTLRLLREIREQGEDTRKSVDGLRQDFAGLRREFDDLRKEAVQGFEHLGERMEHLGRLVRGESVLGRYAAADVDERLETLEKRVSALEDRR